MKTVKLLLALLVLSLFFFSISAFAFPTLITIKTPITLKPATMAIRWNAIGNGFPGSNVAVGLMTRDSNNNIYTAVNLNKSSSRAYTVFKWNGNTWEALAGTVNGPLSGLTANSQNALFACAGGNAAYPGSVYKWTGSGWAALGSSPLVSVQGMAFDPSGTLYAYGYLRVNGMDMKIAKWDGTAWQPFPKQPNGMLYELVIDPLNNIYICGVGGDFSTNQGFVTDNGGVVLKWNGSTNSWEKIGAGNENFSYLSNLQLDRSGDLYSIATIYDSAAFYSLYLYKYDRSANQWNKLGGKIPISCDLLSISPLGTIYIIGNLNSQTAAVKLVGNSWQLFNEALLGQAWGSATDANDNLYASGDFIKTSKGTTVNRVARWGMGLGY